MVTVVVVRHAGAVLRPPVELVGVVRQDRGQPRGGALIRSAASPVQPPPAASAPEPLRLMATPTPTPATTRASGEDHEGRLAPAALRGMAVPTLRGVGIASAGGRGVVLPSWGECDGRAGRRHGNPRISRAERHPGAMRGRRVRSGRPGAAARQAGGCSAHDDATADRHEVVAQSMLIAALLSRAHPCDAGHGGTFGDPCTANPRWKKRGAQLAEGVGELAVDGAVDGEAAPRGRRDGRLPEVDRYSSPLPVEVLRIVRARPVAHDDEDLAVEDDLDAVARPSPRSDAGLQCALVRGPTTPSRRRPADFWSARPPAG